MVLDSDHSDAVDTGKSLSIPAVCPTLEEEKFRQPHVWRLESTLLPNHGTTVPAPFSAHKVHHDR